MRSHRIDRHAALLRAYEIGHDGPPVLWLPGLGIPALLNFLETVTDPVMPPARHLLVDALGTGFSDAPTPPPETLAEQADIIADCLDAFGFPAAHVVGYSFGGAIAIELARRHPDRVIDLMLAEANLFPGGGIASRSIATQPRDAFVATGFAGMLADLRQGGETNPFLDRIAAGWSVADPAALHAAASSLVTLPDDLAESLFALPLRRAFVLGEHSVAEWTATPSADAPSPEVLTRAGIVVEILDGTGHDLMLTNPSGFASIVSNWIVR